MENSGKKDSNEQHHEWSMDKKLISKLEEIGVSRVNMKTLIRSVIKEKSVQDLVQSRIENKSASDKISSDTMRVLRPRKEKSTDLKVKRNEEKLPTINKKDYPILKDNVFKSSGYTDKKRYEINERKRSSSSSSLRSDDNNKKSCIELLSQNWNSNDEDDSDKDPHFSYMAEKDIDEDDDCYKLSRKLTEITKKELEELFKSKNYMLDTKEIPLSPKKRQSFRPIKRATVRELLEKKHQKVNTMENPTSEQQIIEDEMSQKNTSEKSDQDMMFELFGEISNSMDTTPIPEVPANNLHVITQLPSKLVNTDDIQKKETKNSENSVLSKKAIKTPKQIVPAKSNILKKVISKPTKRKAVDHYDNTKNEIPKKRSNLISDLHHELNGKELKCSNVVEAKDKSVCQLIEVADSILPLEIDKVLQSDPNKNLNDRRFAEGYLKKIEKSVNKDTLRDFLSIMKSYTVARDISIPELVEKLRLVFKDYQYLFDGFAPFVLPEQASACGLLTQHSNYNKVKQFFRCIEINYTKKNKPEILNRINNVLKKLATDSSYSVNQMKETVLKVLKDERYLCEEFIRLFPEERPPPSRFHQSETVVWDDSILNKKPNVDKKYEMIVLDTNEEFKPGHPSKFDLKAQKKALCNKKAKILNKTRIDLESVSNVENKQWSKTTSIVEENLQKEQPQKPEEKTLPKDTLKKKETNKSELFWTKSEDQKFLKIIVPIIKLNEKNTSLLDAMFKKASSELKRNVSDLKQRFDHWEEKIREKIKKEEEEESGESDSSDGVSSIEE